MKLTVLRAVPGHSSADLIRALDSGLARMGLKRTVTFDITGRSLMDAMDKLEDDSETELGFNRIVLARVEVNRSLTLKGLYLIKSRSVPEPKKGEIRRSNKKTSRKSSRTPTRKP